MTDMSITILPAASLHALEICRNPEVVASRLKALLGFPLPVLGRSDGTDALRLIRYEPTVWLIEGDVTGLPDILADDGAITAIGGGVVRVCLFGTGWRSLLMEGGVFDAENPTFAPGCSATTIIDHVNVRLHVLSEDSCLAYVPLSFSNGMIHFWQQAVKTLLS